MKIFFQGFEKRAGDPTWGEKQKGVHRAVRASDKGFGRLVVSDELVGKRLNKGLLHGLAGAGAGALAGAGAGALKDGKIGALTGLTLGGLLGGVIGQTHGQYKADKEYLGKRGITPKYLGFSYDFDDKAKKKYITDPIKAKLRRLEE